MSVIGVRLLPNQINPIFHNPAVFLRHTTHGFYVIRLASWFKSVILSIYDPILPKI